MAGHLKGVFYHPIPGGILHLTYADDTMRLLESDNQSTATMKNILLCFEAMPRMKINFAKSVVVATCMDQDEGQRIANLLHYKKSDFLITHLSLPTSDRVFFQFRLGSHYSQR